MNWSKKKDGSPVAKIKTIADLNHAILFAQRFILSPETLIRRSWISRSYSIDTGESSYELTLLAGEVLSRCSGKMNVFDICDQLSVRFPTPSLTYELAEIICEAEQHGWISRQ
ncbi:MAG: hypothetical protein IMF06_09445 [Proteobacteria bacterium]|nr:hypothetical protein [Pseudomonadota bacterium]